MNDPWYFMRWAREQKLGNATRKLILTSLAITAESTTGEGFASQEDLGEYAECSIRTVSSHLRNLEEDGYIARRPRFNKFGKRMPDGFKLLATEVETWSDGDEIRDVKRPHANSSGGHLTSSPPERAVAGELPKNNPSPSKRAGAARKDEVPSGFPDELRPHARSVYKVLRDQAAAMNVKDISVRALGHVLMARPRKPLVKCAYDYCAWLEGKNRTDLVAGYRNWLDGAPDLASTENLNNDGLPAVPIAPLRLAHGTRSGIKAETAAELDRQHAHVASLYADGKLAGLFGRTA